MLWLPQSSSLKLKLIQLSVRPVAFDQFRVRAGFDDPALVKRVRDEAHRFAITYHRELRGKAMTASVLDAVPGLGPKRTKALLKAFGSVKRVRAASVDEVAAVPGIPRAVAEEVVRAVSTPPVAPATDAESPCASLQGPGS